MATTRPDTGGMDDVAASFDKIRANIERVIEGKTDVVRLALVALLAEGHLLIEDVPGVGKTSLAKALAKSLDTLRGALAESLDPLGCALSDSFDPAAGVYGRWFTGATCNTCFNALDRHVENHRADQVALIYDSPVTAAQ